MNRKELIERELESLDNLSDSFLVEVTFTLSNIRKVKVQIFLTDQDKLRLLVLRSWVIKYKISLSYILSNLLPVWEAFVQRRNLKMKKSGLNVYVSTLTGKKSEEMLIQLINKDYPDKLNISVFRTNEQERIYAKSKLVKEDIRIATPSIKTLERYVSHYKSSIKKEIKRREKIEELFQKYPYRDNPWT